MRDPSLGCIGGLCWEIVGVIAGRFPRTSRAALCAEHQEVKTAFDSLGVAPESPYGTTFREHFPGESKFEALRPSAADPK
jgi:hypothetical protein